MSIEDFLDYGTRFNKKLIPISGLIIYPDNDDVPQDVILIPYNAVQGESLRIIIERLLPSSVKGIFTYFQGIRWVQPKLKDLLKDWQYIKGSFIGQHFFERPDIRISYGVITFDQTYVDDEPVEPEIQRETCINLLDREYSLTVEDFPREIGVPKLFEKIDLINPN